MAVVVVVSVVQTQAICSLCTDYVPDRDEKFRLGDKKIMVTSVWGGAGYTILLLLPRPGPGGRGPSSVLVR